MPVIGSSVVNPTLSTEATCVESWLELRDLTGNHSLYFLYYDPSGALYTTTTEDWRLEPDSKKAMQRRSALRMRASTWW